MDFGADAIGFIFVPGTPRYIGADLVAAKIPKHLPPFVRTVAVYRDMRDVHSRWERNFGLIQVYENVWGARFSAVNRVIRACRIADEASLEKIASEPFPAGTILLDAYHPDKLGGSGETFDWDLACEAKARFRKPIILAGGLTSENVQDALAAVQPYAVDVSSGVEAEPGVKDHGKMRAFIRAVREFDVRHGD